MSCLVLLTSCSQETIVPNEKETSNTLEQRSEKPVLRDDGIYHFTGEEAFGSYMQELEYLSEKELEKITENDNFQSFKQSSALNRNGASLDHAALSATLNQDAAISIGEHIFKLNPATEEVYVIDATASPRLLTLMLNADNTSRLPSSIQVFSFDDDVFGELSIPNIGHHDFPVWLRCDAADSDEDLEDSECLVDFGNGISCNFKGLVKARYFKGGILFRLTARFEHGNVCRFDIAESFENTDFKLHIDARWNRCGQVGEEMFPPDMSPIENFGNEWLEPLYNNTRRLKTFSVSTFAEFDCGGQTPSVTPTASISS